MKLINNTICGNCSRCGECCSDLLHLDQEEIKTIDEYLKTHKVFRGNNREDDILDITCPFFDSILHRCQIYEVRPLICKEFKCDRMPQDAVELRDKINSNKKIRSMTELFFNDKKQIKKIKERLGINVYGREQ